MTNNSSKFIDAYNDISNNFCEQCQKDSYCNFTDLIKLALDKNLISLQIKDDLKQFAILRNAIIHESRSDKIIAEPNDWAVQRIEQIRDLVIAPPKLRSFMNKPTVFKTSDSISKVLKIVVEKDYSQFPIIEQNHFQGLLTSNTIARWLGHKVEQDLISLLDSTVVEVMEFTENPNNFIFMKPDDSVFRLIDKLQVKPDKQLQIEAVLFTNSAKETETLLGILTIWDLPRLYQAIAL